MEQVSTSKTIPLVFLPSPSKQTGRLLVRTLTVQRLAVSKCVCVDGPR